MGSQRGSMRSWEESAPTRWFANHLTALAPASLRVALAAIAALGILLTSCDDNDPTAPADSTIVIGADPATVVVDPNAGTAGSSLITATLLSKNGTRLPDQEMIFTTSQGTLDPPAQTILTTDDVGIATSILTTTQTATVTARSGNISAPVTVQTSSAPVSAILLNVSTTSVDDCDDTIDVTARVVTSGGLPVSGFSVQFFQNTPPSLHDGVFSQTIVQSDVAGEAKVTWRPTLTDCTNDCFGGNDCDPMAELQASDLQDTIFSNLVTLNDDIP